MTHLVLKRRWIATGTHLILTVTDTYMDTAVSYAINMQIEDEKGEVIQLAYLGDYGDLETAIAAMYRMQNGE